MGVAVVVATFLMVVCSTDIPVVFVMNAPILRIVGKAVLVTTDSGRQRQLNIHIAVAVSDGIHTVHSKEPDDGPDAGGDAECYQLRRRSAVKGKAMPH
jgi:hypothetical protein